MVQSVSRMKYGATLKPRLILAAFGLAVAALTVVVYASNSAYVTLELESVAISGATSSTSDSSASGGQAVKFGEQNPVGFMMPTASIVGARCTPTETISSSVALARLRANGTLSCAIVTGVLELEGTDGIDWIIEDVKFEAQGSLYVLDGYRRTGVDPFAGTQAQRPIFRHVDLVGGAVTGHGSCSSVIIGKDMRIEHANITGCRDGIKADDRLEVRHSWIHDNDKPDGAHSDGVQIVSGQDIVFEGNRFDAYSTYSSDGSMTPGTWDYASGMLQTGTITGNISATWNNNWFAGGRYTIRGAVDEPGIDVNYIFRNNRWLRYGTSVALGLTNLPAHQYGPIYTLGDADLDCSNVWDDTEEPIIGGC